MKKNFRQSDLPQAYNEAFKNADIRGVYETEIDEVLAYRVAKAFVASTGASKVLVGRDMRNSSPALEKAFVAGVRDAGAKAIKLGLVTTPMLYFASGSQEAHGVMITASHNPAQYNGLKLVLPGAVPLTAKTGLNKIQKSITGDLPNASIVGKEETLKIKSAYESYIKEKISSPKKKAFKILVDAGNGMGSLLVPLLKCYATVEALFTELDGNFPNRGSNPTLRKNQKPITTELKKGGYDFGIAFDGDADRVAFFDEKGNYLNAALVGAYLAKNFLRQNKKRKMVGTILNSRTFAEVVESQGGKLVLARVGHAFIKQAMRKHDALFGCENSAHFYFKDNYYADSGILTVLNFLNALSFEEVSQTQLSNIFKGYQNYYQTEEKLIEVTDKDLVLSLFKKWGEEAKLQIDDFDGVRVMADDWWLAGQKSVTEDAIKFVVEAKTEKIAESIYKEVMTIIKPHQV